MSGEPPAPKRPRQDKASRSSEARPPRFELELPVWYRSASDRQWHTGTTANVSAHGALIHPDGPILPSSPLVIAIALPSVGGCLVGRGRIARTIPTAEGSNAPAFAVAVSRYRIHHRDAVLVRATH